MKRQEEKHSPPLCVLRRSPSKISPHFKTKMHIENRNLTWTLMSLFLTGVLCNTWKVEYHQQHICAVSGSSVVVSCSFYYPDTHTVKRLMWGHRRSIHSKVPFISVTSLNKATAHRQYIGDNRHNCSLKIHRVEHRDVGLYTFRFTTDSQQGKWTGRVGSTLKVVDLNISTTKPDGRTKEGDSVKLTCSNGCDGGDRSSALTWFKNGEAVNEGPELYLSNVSSTDSGNYTCSLRKHTGTTSAVINIDVEYGPKNTSVSVRPSVVMDPGSNVTMICSSHARPPVENYTWFKIDGDDIMDVGHLLVFFPHNCGQYFCCATNMHGSQNSSVVTLKIKAHWATFTRYALLVAVVAMILMLIILIAVRRLHIKRMQTPKAASEDIENTDYVNWLTGDSYQSQEGNECEGGTPEVIYTSVHFKNNKKSNMRKQMISCTDDEHVIYVTVRTNVEPF